MNYLILAISVLVLAGCTDANRSSLMSYGAEARVVCYSGGVVVFDDVSSGKVQKLDGDGIAFQSKTTNKHVRAFADCIATN